MKQILNIEKINNNKLLSSFILYLIYTKLLFCSCESLLSKCSEIFQIVVLIKSDQEVCNQFGFVCANCTSFRLCPDVGMAPAIEVMTCVNGFKCNMESDLICGHSCVVPEFVCYSPGLHPDPQDCRAYYTCSPKRATNGFYKHRFPCPNNLRFDPTTKRCVATPVENCP